MKPTIFILAAGLAAAPAFADNAASAAATAPIVVSGTVVDDASKAALLGRLRAVYGPERVVDQLAVGRVSAPPNWNEHVARLMDRT